MKKGLIAAFGIFGILLFLGGCNGIPGFGGKDPSSNPYSYSSVHKGSEGLALEFLQNAPPSGITAPAGSDTTFPIGIGVKISNNGASNVENGYIAITTEDDYIHLSEFKRGISISGRDVLNLEGESKIEIFQGTAKGFKDTAAKKHISTVIATACYRYSTEVKQEACIDTDILGLSKKEKTCTVTNFELSDQGAPVAVTKIEPKMYPQGSGDKIESVKPEFSIHLKNVGGGLIVDPSAEPNSVCSSASIADRNSEDFRKIWNTVAVSAKLSDKELTCYPSKIQLNDEDSIVRCSTEAGINPGTPTYNTPLTITLNYGYITKISREVAINKEPA